MFKGLKIITILVLCTLIFLTGCNSTKTQLQTKGGLKINSWSSGLGGVNETNLDKTKFSYSINLSNGNNTNIYVKSIEPLVNEKIKNIILSKDIAVTVNKDVKPGETIQINGEIIIDTKGLTKSDIMKLEPFITDVKISSEETISLKNN
jgi:hypothetical protein